MISDDSEVGKAADGDENNNNAIALTQQQVSTPLLTGTMLSAQ